MKQNARSWQPTGVQALTESSHHGVYGLFVHVVVWFVAVVFLVGCFFCFVLRFKECFLAASPFFREAETI